MGTMGLVYLLLIMAAAFIILGLVGLPERRPRIVLMSTTALEEPEGIEKFKLGKVFALLAPFSQKLMQALKVDEKVKSRLAAAHIKLNAQEFFSIKLLLIPFLGVLAFFTIGKAEPLAVAGTLALGYIIPDLMLNRKIAQRKSEIARLLPETIDLLGLCVEAGLDFSSSVRWVIEKTPKNHLLDEFSFVLEEIKWGKPRIQALKDMSKRLNVPEVSSFVQTLVQAERMGTPVSEAFSILSEDARLHRFHYGERIALQAPIKILIPLIFCILPVIAIVVGGPIFLQFMQGGLMGGFK